VELDDRASSKATKEKQGVIILGSHVEVAVCRLEERKGDD